MLSNFDNAREVRFDVAIKNSKVGDKNLYAVAQEMKHHGLTPMVSSCSSLQLVRLEPGFASSTNNTPNL